MGNEDEIIDIIKNKLPGFKKVKIGKVSNDEILKLEKKLKKEGKIKKQLSFF